MEDKPKAGVGDEVMVAIEPIVEMFGLVMVAEVPIVEMLCVILLLVE